MLAARVALAASCEWKWEKLNRTWVIFAAVGTWVCRFAVFGLAAYQMYLRDNPLPWVNVTILVLSAISMSLPVLVWKLNWKERMRLHDKAARAYELIKVKLDTGVMSLSDAHEAFDDLYSKSQADAAVGFDV